VEIQQYLLLPAIEQIISDVEDAAGLTTGTDEGKKLDAALGGYWTAIYDLIRKAS
jgi:hypothetical protein